MGGEGGQAAEPWLTKEGRKRRGCVETASEVAVIMVHVHGGCPEPDTALRAAHTSSPPLLSNDTLGT